MGPPFITAEWPEFSRRTLPTLGSLLQWGRRSSRRSGTLYEVIDSNAAFGFASMGPPFITAEWLPRFMARVTTSGLQWGRRSSRRSGRSTLHLRSPRIIRLSVSAHLDGTSVAYFDGRGLEERRVRLLNGRAIVPLGVRFGEIVRRCRRRC